MEFVKEIEMAKEIEFLKIHSSQLRYVTNFSEFHVMQGAEPLFLMEQEPLPVFNQKR